MPTIHREAGFEFVIYTLDHPPSHVHVIDGDGECIIFLGSDEERPSVRSVEGMKPKRRVLALRIVLQRQKQFLRKWREIHGS